jgi:hypothetical protein
MADSGGSISYNFSRDRQESKLKRQLSKLVASCNGSCHARRPNKKSRVDDKAKSDLDEEMHKTLYPLHEEYQKGLYRIFVFNENICYIPYYNIEYMQILYFTFVSY